MPITPTPRDSAYDPVARLLRMPATSSGYHTRITVGAPAHPLRESATYAAELLDRGDEASARRAVEILGALLPLQAQDPTRREFGIWSYYLEEPLEAMAPPDWNWADFIGLALGRILVRHGERLPAPLREAVRAGLRNAAWSIFRRNVGPSYTNICALGGAVAAIAGEALGEPLLSEYGVRRLANLRCSTEATGDFEEYNSPTYFGVTLEAAEAVSGLCHTSAARDEAERLRVLAWTQLAERWHHATGQLAGPHSRAYADVLDRSWTTRLAALDALPAPLRERFTATPKGETSLVRCVVPRSATVATTWMSATVCLGSVSHECFWSQRRPLIAYWPTEGSQPAVLRLRFLKDGRDFASGGAAMAQSRGRVLVNARLFPDCGDWHLHLDRPADGVFQMERLSLRWELTAPDARVESLAPGRIVLAAGSHRAVIHRAPGFFDARPVQWRDGIEGGKAFVEAVLYEGSPVALRCADPGIVALATAAEVVSAGAYPSDTTPTLACANDAVVAAWDELQATVPRSPSPYF